MTDSQQTVHDIRDALGNFLAEHKQLQQQLDQHEMRWERLNILLTSGLVQYEVWDPRNQKMTPIQWEGTAQQIIDALDSMTISEA